MSSSLYTPCGLDGYELCHPINQSDFETINTLVNGVPRASRWNPIAMRTILQDEGRTLLKSDSPWLGAHALMFKPRALTALAPLLDAYGELLPLLANEGTISMYNPTRVLDALDESRSALHRFSDGSIMMIQRYAFREEIIRGVDIFKISALRVSPTFVSQRFVDLWHSSGLRGLEFECVGSV